MIFNVILGISIAGFVIFFIGLIIFLALFAVYFLKGRIQTKCDACGAMVPSAAQFCPRCGGRLFNSGKEYAGKKRFLSFLWLALGCFAISCVFLTGIISSSIHLAYGAGAGDHITAVGRSETLGSGNYTLSFKYLNGSETQQIKLGQGDASQMIIMPNVKKGNLTVTVLQGNTRKSVRLNNVITSIDLSEFEEGSARLMITADAASDGSVRIAW